MKYLRLRLLCLGLAIAHGAVLAQHQALAEQGADDESAPAGALAAELAPVLPPVAALKVKLFRRPVNVLGYQSAEPATLAQWRATAARRTPAGG